MQGPLRQWSSLEKWFLGNEPKKSQAKLGNHVSTKLFTWKIAHRLAPKQIKQQTKLWEPYGLNPYQFKFHKPRGPGDDSPTGGGAAGETNEVYRATSRFYTEAYVHLVSNQQI